MLVFFLKKLSEIACLVYQPFLLAQSAKFHLDDLNKLHEDFIKMKDQKSNVNAMWTHFQTKLEKSIYVNVPKQIARKKDGAW
jgi:predicted component of type VI protein secretion system